MILCVDHGMEMIKEKSLTEGEAYQKLLWVLVAPGTRRNPQNIGAVYLFIPVI